MPLIIFTQTLGQIIYFWLINTNFIKSPKIHIVSFDIPSPPNYGGVIDVFYKVKSLYDLGYQITLHCYEYNHREISEELNKYCFRIYTYTRNFILVNPLKFYMPYIVFTRNHRMLLYQLLQDDAPILFEGLHTTYFLNHPKLNKRVKLVRMHNIEHDYYAALGKNEDNLFNKIYYLTEAFLLKKYEKILHKTNAVLAISSNDLKQLEQRKLTNVHLVPAFHGFELNIDIESKYYALYHGKLNVNENDVAAQFLVKEVFSKIDYPLVIAGNNPTEELFELIKPFKHIRLIKNPNMKQMEDIIKDAHMHVLPTFQATGIKLKLLHVLYNGKFIIANKEMIENTGLSKLVTEANGATEMINAVNNLASTTFDLNESELRKTVLSKHFNNIENAKKIDAIINQLTQIN